MDSEFCTSMPKVELHAHLNGSLSEAKINELLKSRPDFSFEQSSTVIDKGEKRTLDECFTVFRIIQSLTDNVETIANVTESVITDFERENVRYLELRSTPRANLCTGMTKRSYIEAVLHGIRRYQHNNGGGIDVRFLLSIDRRQKLEEASATIELAKEYALKASDIVAGVDLSGDPHVGCATDFIPLLQTARYSGLKLSLHMAEIAGMDDENHAILQIPPDRIGHGTFLFENEECRSLVTENRIPLEICLSSNVKSRTVKSFHDEHHHIHKWRKLGQPIVICTDDKGVFSTSLSNEYKIASQACDMDAKELYELSKSSIDSIFADDHTKKKLLRHWEQWKCGQGSPYFPA